MDYRASRSSAPLILSKLKPFSSTTDVEKYSCPFIKKCKAKALQGATMKLAFAFLSLMISFSAFAADRKIGNVIVVERDVDNIYDRCMEDLNRKPASVTQKANLACFVVVTNNPGEVLMNKGGAFKSTNPKCYVDTEFGGSGMLIDFSSKELNATAAEAKRCLREALNANPDIIATIQTIER
jgi:hypothetical protein